MFLRSLLALLATAAAPLAQAAVTAQLVTPQAMSVAGGETKSFSARFFNAQGQPAVGETIQFSNDVCGLFPNGGFFMDTVTDATGTATLNFTAMNPAGITCWLNAISLTGAAIAHFDVHTYQPSLVVLSAATSPAAPRTGESFTLQAAVLTGAYHLYNLDVAARVIPGTASATLSPATRSTGGSGVAEFTVVPDGRLGAYDIELTFKGKTRTIHMTAGADGVQDMWWAGAAENGWGMSIVQHPTNVFSVIYAYDIAGKPTWYVIPAGAWNAAHTAITGAVYSPRGAPYSAYDASKFIAGDPVGNATLTFTDLNTATLDYTIHGATGRKSITRQPFGLQDSGYTATVGDMYWGGVAQNGWGIGVLQQYRTLFSIWYTYDANGAPTWFVMPNGSWSDINTYEGRLYRTTGSPWLGAAYDPARLQAIDVGTFRLRFGRDGADFDYMVDGKGATMALTHQPF